MEKRRRYICSFGEARDGLMIMEEKDTSDGRVDEGLKRQPFLALHLSTPSERFVVNVNHCFYIFNYTLFSRVPTCLDAAHFVVCFWCPFPF